MHFELRHITLHTWVAQTTLSCRPMRDLHSMRRDFFVFFISLEISAVLCYVSNSYFCYVLSRYIV